MVALKINNFGGIAPRVPTRELADESAQVNHNLLASAKEFRPLLGPTVVSTAPAGAKTLYRMARASGGALQSNDTSNWRANTRELSYAPGQLNDDATERTVMSYDDGRDAPRQINADGADRLLGVPAPLKPSLEHTAEDRYTKDKAQEWLDTGFKELLNGAVAASIYADTHDPEAQRICRWADGKPRAGALSAHGFAQDPNTSWLMYYDARSNMLGSVALSLPGYQPGMDKNIWRVTVAALPFWGYMPAPADKAKPTLVDSLMGIMHPGTGDPIFTTANAAKAATAAIEHLSPTGKTVMALRQALDKKQAQLLATLDGTATTSVEKEPPSSNPKPTSPTVPEYRTEGEDQVRHPLWVAYYADMRAWEQREIARLENNTSVATSQGVTVETARALVDEITTISNQIEVLWMTQLGTVADHMISAIGGTSVSTEEGKGFMTVEPDRAPDTRFYITTHVTDWGEESAPSVVSDMVEVDPKESVKVTRGAVPPGRNITHWRIYRSNTGTTDTAFQFVEELLVTRDSFDDVVKSEALGEVCPTIGWAEPPYRMDLGSPSTVKPPKGVDPYLRGVVAMPNGIVAGFIDNFVAFSEPYHAYAWPVAYQITTDSPIVGLGVFGQTLFVGTMGAPYFISGADSMSMSAVRLDADQACVSRRSIVSLDGGVVYASPDGLCLATQAGVQLVTSAYFSREDWQQLDPRSIFAVGHENAYYFWAAGQCYVLDIESKKLGTVDMPATAAFRDLFRDHLFVVEGSNITRVFSEGRRTAVWKSRKLTLPQQVPVAWLRVFGDQSPSKPVRVTWTADDRVRYEVDITGIEPVRVPPGRYLEHEIQIESTARVTQVTLAGSTEELKGI